MKAFGLGYEVFADDPIHFRKPDLLSIKMSRLNGIDLNDGFASITADVEIYVISLNDPEYDDSENFDEDINAGFGQVWLVRPNGKSVTVYRPDEKISFFHAKSGFVSENLSLLHLEVFENFERQNLVVAAK